MRELVVGPVDPVPGEPAGSDQRVLRPPVRVERQRERRPDEWRLPLYERAPAHPPGCRDPRATAAGLHEPHPAVAPLRLALDVRQLDGLEAVPHRAEVDQSGAHEAPTLVTAVDDPVAVDCDEGPEFVRKAEPVLVPEALDVHAFARGRWVVMRDPRVEGQALGTLDRLRGDPGERRDETGVPGEVFSTHGRQPLPADLG